MSLEEHTLQWLTSRLPRGALKLGLSDKIRPQSQGFTGPDPVRFPTHLPLETAQLN